MRFKLQELRKETGFRSAKAFAREIDMPVGTYTNYEQGATKLTLEMPAASPISSPCHWTSSRGAGSTSHPHQRAIQTNESSWKPTDLPTPEAKARSCAPPRARRGWRGHLRLA